MIKILYSAIRWLPANIINWFNIKKRKVSIGKNVCILGVLFIRGKGKIQIGDNVRINSCREANPIGGDIKSVLFAKQNGRIKIGNNVGISNSAIVAMQDIEIEDNVLIGGSCKIYDHDFHSMDYKKRASHCEDDICSKPILIREGAFIGANSIILKGVTIGKHSIIGAGSVVTKDVPDDEIWGGNPARYIRSLE